MKANTIVLVLVVVIMLALTGGAYFLFMRQGQMSGKNLEAVKADIEKLSAALKDTGAQFKDLEDRVKGTADSLKGLEDKVALGDTERKDVAAKVDSLMKAVEELKGGATTVSAEPEAAVSVSAPAPEATVVSETPVVTEAAPAIENSPVDLGQIPVEK